MYSYTILNLVVVLVNFNKKWLNWTSLVYLLRKVNCCLYVATHLINFNFNNLNRGYNFFFFCRLARQMSFLVRMPSASLYVVYRYMCCTVWGRIIYSCYLLSVDNQGDIELRLRQDQLLNFIFLGHNQS